VGILEGGRLVGLWGPFLNELLAVIKATNELGSQLLGICAELLFHNDKRRGLP